MIPSTIKNNLLLFLTLFTTYGVYAQPFVSPGVNSEICPSTPAVPNNVYLSFDFGNNSPSNYSIVNAVGVSVVAQVNAAGQATVQFSDKRETHQFQIKHSSQGIVGTYTFTKVKTLDGVTGAFTGGLPVQPPYGYGDILPASLAGLCKTAPFRYNSPAVYYKDAAGANFSTTTPMLNYEWLVPKGWKVNGTVSDGVTPIGASVFAEITPDALTTGEFKIRARNTFCNPDQLARSTWFKVYVDRGATNLTVVSNKANINCGEQPAITFSVSNTTGITCISGYTWNVGPGWRLPNGSLSPATAYSTGAANSITLTPDCGKALGTVAAVITAGGTLYNSADFVTTPVIQTSKITGIPYLCNGNTTYTITPLPCNSSVLWTAPSSSLGVLSSLTTVPTTLTYAGTSGYIDLKASLTACGVTTALVLPIHVGNFSANDYSIGWNNGTPPYYCLNQNITFTLSGGGLGTGYSWSNPSATVLPRWTKQYQSNNIAVYKTPTSGGYPPTGSVGVQFSEPCGTPLSKYFQVVYSSSYCGTASSPYSITPNPASSTITIACISLQTYCNIAQVQITDIYGTVKSNQSWPNTNQQVQMPVSFLPNGTYIAKVYSGTQWYSNTFIVQH